MRKFGVWFCDDNEKNKEDVEVFNEEEAAEKFVASMDFDLDVGRGYVADEVFVRDLSSGEVKKFIVKGEFVPSYSAEEVNLEDEK